MLALHQLLGGRPGLTRWPAFLDAVADSVEPRGRGGISHCIYNFFFLFFSWHNCHYFLRNGIQIGRTLLDKSEILCDKNHLYRIIYSLFHLKASKIGY